MAMIILEDEVFIGDSADSVPVGCTELFRGSVPHAPPAVIATRNSVKTN